MVMGRIVIVCYIMHYCVSLGVIVQCACMLWSKLMQARGGAAGCVNIDLMARSGELGLRLSVRIIVCD